MKVDETVTYGRLNATFQGVLAEFTELGIWHLKSRLLKTDVVWCGVAPPWLWAAQGFFVERCRLSELGKLIGYWVTNRHNSRVLRRHPLLMRKFRFVKDAIRQIARQKW